MDCFPPELGLASMEENKDAPLLSKKSMELFWGYYNPARHNPLVGVSSVSSQL